MATAARPAWTSPTPPDDGVEGSLKGVGSLVLPAAGGASGAGGEDGSQTERARGRHGGRPGGVVRRRHFATSRSRFAAKMEKRRVGATLDNMSLETEAHINRKLAEMHERDLTTVNRLAAKLRKDYDRLRVQSTAKAQELRAVQEHLTRLERLSAAQKGGDLDKIQAAKQRLANTTAAYDEVKQKRHMYTFMATRLKKQTMQLDSEAKDLQDVLAVTRQDREQATLNLHAAKQERAAAEALAAKLQKKLDKGRAHRAAKLARFDSTIVEQGEKRKQMEMREQRRVEIARLAQGDLNEEGEDRLKQLFLVRKIYSSMLLSKLQDQRRKTDRLEDAFQRIRSATGLTDVDAIVEKFLNREETNERLVKQMADARARIDDLRHTHVRLQQLLDAQTMVKETHHENRQLYHKVDDFDRRLTEARRMSEEAKHRSFKVMIALEESRACIAKLLNKLDFDPSMQHAHARRGQRSTRQIHSTAGGAGSGPAAASAAASAAGAASSPAPGHTSPRISTADSAANATDGFQMQHGKLVVSIDALPEAVHLLDQRLTKYLEIVAAIFEKEEQLAAHSKSTEDPSAGAVRRMSLASAKEVIATVATSGPSLLNNLSARQQPGMGGDTAAARRSTLSMLAGKASSRVYRSMMDIQPDISAANLRVKPPTETAASSFMDSDTVASDEGDSENSDDYFAGLAEAAELSDSAAAAHRRSRKAGIVVQRDSIKRLSAMLSDKRTRRQRSVRKNLGLSRKRLGVSAADLDAAAADADAAATPGPGASPRTRSPFKDTLP